MVTGPHPRCPLPPTLTVRLSSTLSSDRRELTAEALPLSFDPEALDGEGGGAEEERVRRGTDSEEDLEIEIPF